MNPHPYSSHLLTPTPNSPTAVPRAWTQFIESDAEEWRALTALAHDHGHRGNSVVFCVTALALATAFAPGVLTVGLRAGGVVRTAVLPDPTTITVAQWWQQAEAARSTAWPRDPDSPMPVLIDLDGEGAVPAGTLLRWAPTEAGTRFVLWSVRPHIPESTVERVESCLRATTRALVDPRAWSAPPSQPPPTTGDVWPPTEHDGTSTPTRVDSGHPTVEGREGRAELAAQALRAHTTVRAVHVQFEEAGPPLGPGDHNAATTLVCYVEPETDTDPDALRAYARLRLPAGCVPHRWIVVERLEPAPNGRLDPARWTRALTESTTRGALGQIWAEELGVDAVGVEDDFFALGGDSLVATRVLARIRAELGADLDLGEALRLLSVGSLRAVARALHTRPRDTTPDPLPEIEHRPQDRFEVFPLTDQQQAYALGRGDTFSSGNIACHTYMEFSGTDLDPRRFRRAWARLVERHDMLRAQVDPESLTQWIDPSLGTNHVVHTDLTALDDHAVREELRRTRERLSHRVSDLTGAPLYDVVVLSLPGGHYRVCIGFDGLIADLAGTGVLYSDLARLYADPDIDLAPVGLSFRDYVLAERRAVGGSAYRRAKDYWARRVAELPPAPDLPLTRDPATITNPRFTPRPATIDAEIWGRVRAEAAARGITPSGLLATCYAETIGGWSRSRHFTLNLPSFNRLPLHTDVGSAVGEFASLILVEVDSRAEEPFADLARRVQAQIWRDLGHQHVTGVEVLRDLTRRHGGFARAVMPFVFTSTVALAGDPTTLLDGRLDRVYRVAQTPQVWIDLIVEEADTTLHLNWDSLEGLFPEGLMDDMFAAFLRLVTSLADPAAWDASAPDPRPEAQVRAHAAMAGPTRPIPEEPAHAAFWRRARQTPDAPAVVGGDSALTYGELADRASRIACWLRAGGATPDQPVAVLMGRHVRQVAAIHGILAAGAPYLPLDVDAPAGHTAAILDRVGARQVITTSGDLDASWAQGRDILELDTTDLPEPASDAPRPDTAEPSHLAYVLFTSGSTGQPKGVMVEHRSLVNCVRETTAALAVDAHDRFLTVSAVHHDMSVYDLFGVLGAGGCLVVPDAEERRDAHRWAALVQEHAVTGWVSVPAMMEMLLEAAEEGQLTSLRTVVLGGDWVAPATVRALRGAAPGVAVRSIGGPTETTVWNIWHPVREQDLASRTIPYGAAIANTRYHVLDTRLRDRPTLAVGELCCTGASLARGYWDDPERTAATFVTHPTTGERLYRTGDLGYFGRDGLIEFVGRDDLQVKVRGQRIETGEVEAALMAHPRVAACVVTGVPHRDRPGYRGLAGYVVPSAEGAVDIGAIRAHLTERLPAPMVPATLMTLAALPLNANGKVDRAALPHPEEERPAAADRPRGALEEFMAGRWVEALGTTVGREDNFFELGGDSLIATRIASRVRAELPGAHLTLRDLFAAPTIAGCCAVMREAEEEPARLEEVARLTLEIAALEEAEIDARLQVGNEGGHS